MCLPGVACAVNAAHMLERCGAEHRQQWRFLRMTPHRVKDSWERLCLDTERARWKGLVNYGHMRCRRLVLTVSD